MNMKNILLSFATLLFMSVVFNSCSKSDSPAGVIEEYYAAYRSADIDKMIDCTNLPEERIEGERYNLQMMFDSGENFWKKMKVRKLEETIDGDYATVTGEFTSDGENWKTVTFELVQVNGKWKMDR